MKQIMTYKVELAEELKTTESSKNQEIESYQSQIEELKKLAQAANDEEQKKLMLQQKQTEVNELQAELADLKSKESPPGACDNIDDFFF